MSGIETIGAIISLASVAIDSYKHLSQVYKVYNKAASARAARRAEYGLFTAYILDFFPEALSVMNRVERYVLQAEDVQAVAFMKSYTSSFNMIGVAGAIIAQVAITAIGLTRVEDSHWTAEAFFVVSLVSGALSVFFSCAISPAFHGLHNADAIKDFLAKPTTQMVKKLEGILNSAENHPRLSQSHLESLKQIYDARWRVPSAYAAIMLTVPMTLLNIALNAFLVGLGIYLGRMYTEDLIPSYGLGSLGILIFFLVTAVLGIGTWYIPQRFKSIEEEPLARYRGLLHANKASPPAIQPPGETTTPADNVPPPEASSTAVPQSMHSPRSGGGVRYDIPEDQIVTPSAPAQADSARPSADAVFPQPSQNTPASRPSSPEPNIAEMLRRPDFSDMMRRGSREVGSESMQAALADLIQAQQATLLASQRLMEAFQQEGEHP